MWWTIITIILMSICLYVLGYCTAKLDSLKKFKKATDKIQEEVLNRDLSDEYQRGHAWGLLHAVNIIQKSDMFKEE